MFNCNPTRAFSLVEILIVIAIIALLAALIFPALSQAKRQSKGTVCVEQMKQLYLGLSLYREEHNGELRSLGLGGLTESYVKDKRMLLCPLDEFQGLMTSQYRCLRYRFKNDQSYYTPFAAQTYLWDKLQKADPNPGVIACRNHGEHVEKLNVQGCERLAFVLEGKVQRIRNDGSLKIASVSARNASGNFTFSLWSLFSDEPPPSE